MFITNEAGKSPIPSALFGEDDSSYWGYVRQHLHVPWFYCTYKEEFEDGGELRHMVLLSHTEQLQQLFQLEDLKVVEVQVVLPAHMTKQGRWIMEPLASIWVGEVLRDDYTEYVYVTLDGRRFCINGKITTEDQLTDKRLLFKSPVYQAA